MGFSAYLENKLLGHAFGGTSFTMPSTLYFGLWTDALEPTDTTPGIEVTGGSYARVALTSLSSNMTITGTAPTKIENTVAISWNVASADWGDVTYAAIFDAPTGGNVLTWGELVNPKNVTAGDMFQIAIGEYEITLN